MQHNLFLNWIKCKQKSILVKFFPHFFFVCLFQTFLKIFLKERCFRDMKKHQLNVCFFIFFPTIIYGQKVRKVSDWKESFFSETTKFILLYLLLVFWMLKAELITLEAPSQKSRLHSRRLQKSKVPH